MTLDPLEDLTYRNYQTTTPRQEYQALLRALRRQAGFGIIFVRCSPTRGAS
jgi:hypothetical protein